MSSEKPVDTESNVEEKLETPSVIIELEPIKDHNNIPTTDSQSPTEKPVTDENKPKIRRKLIKLPKTIKLIAVYNCKLCNYSTMKKDVFEAHSKEHKNIKKGTKYKSCKTSNVNTNSTVNCIQCSECSFTTKSQHFLKIHMRVHTLGTSYKCTECDYRGKNIKDLANHYKTAKTFCDFCTFSCHMKKKMLAHQKLHETSKYAYANI